MDLKSKLRDAPADPVTRSGPSEKGSQRYRILRSDVVSPLPPLPSWLLPTILEKADSLQSMVVLPGWFVVCKNYRISGLQRD
jgi:hypothetical protein